MDPSETVAEAAAAAKTVAAIDVGSNAIRMVIAEVLPDGQIEVTRRGGDADLTDVYRDEADLETRDPSMYQRYRSLPEPTGPADPP